MMEEQAIQSDLNLGLPLYNVKEIYSDPNFNCRGHISPLDVIDLAKNIAQCGLQEPVVIRPRTPETPPGFKYVLISGHRRHYAYIVNQRDVIPAILRTNISDDFTARTLNAIENLHRQDLNILQEAKAIEHYKNARWSREDVATELGMSMGWVQVRYMLLDLPSEIQEAAAAGFFSQQQIRDLYSIKGRDNQLTAALKIKEAKIRNDDKKVEIIERKPQLNSKKRRDKKECIDMMETIVKNYGRNNFGTRCLAWANGEITTRDLLTDLKELCASEGIIYEIPSDG